MRLDVLGTLEDINEAIEYILEDSSGISFESFMNDRRRRQAVERNFEIMGEAVNRLYRHAPALAEQITASRKVVNFRNALAHGYDTIDYSTVWEIIHQFLPVTHQEIEEVIREAESGNV